ncbi:MAG: SoxR reducing system RseC family protein [Thermotogaceae bacterium]|nr:SoxR reducing system RseC family protein [Thermotogaceae bacterium]
MKEKMMVVTVNNDIAILKKIDNEGSCENCAMALLCKRNEEEATIKASTNQIEVKPGDIVLVKTPRASITKVSFFIYTLPLLIFIASILIFKKCSFSDEASFLYSLIFLGIYYFILKLLDKKLTKKFAPKVVKVLNKNSALWTQSKE